MKLLIMGCSGTKRPGPGPMTALDRYDGPMWKTLRARLAELPAAHAAVQAKDLRIYVISALFGFIPADVEVPDYDRRMTPELAGKMARDPSFDFQYVPHLVKEADAVMLAAGAVYRDAIWRASGNSLWNLTKVVETDGAGIGVHRAQLGSWLQTHYGEAA